MKSNILNDKYYEKKHRRLTAVALAVSLVFHLAVVHHVGVSYLSVLARGADESRVIEENVIRYRFVETEKQEKVEKMAQKVESISDKDSQADSSRKGDVRDKAPKGEKQKDK